MVTPVWIDKVDELLRVNITLYIFLIFSNSKKNMKLQLGRRMHTTFHTGRIQSCCYLVLKKKLIYNELISHFMYSYVSLFGCNIQTSAEELTEASISYYFTWISLQAFCLLLGTANLRNNSSLVRTISIVTCRSDKWRIHFLVKLHGEPYLTACLNKVKFLIGKHFFHYFKENLGIHLTHFIPVWSFM